MTSVAFVAPFGLGQKTTVWARTLPLAQALVALGHQARIVIPPWDTPEDSGRSWRDEGVDIINVPLRGGIPGTVFAMLGQLDEARPDIIHIVKPRAHAGLVQWRVWQKRRRPPLLLDIDDWEQAWAEINDYGAVTSRFLGRQEEWGIRHADGISAASRWLEAKAKAYRPHTPRLYLPNGVEIPQRAASNREAPKNAPTVLFFSRFVEVEPAWLASFWQALLEEMPNARLIVAGTPVEPGREQAFIEAVNALGSSAKDAVTWRGFVPTAELDGLYAHSSCAIFPAAPTPLQAAKCSVRLATTLLHGVPVVASAVGEQANYGAHGAARLVPATASAADFASATASLLRTPVAQREMISRARRHLRANYQWRDLAASLADFYAHILASR